MRKGTQNMAVTIQELIDKRAKAWTAAREFVDTHEKNGILSAEDTETYQKMEADIASYTDAINRETRAAQTDIEMSKTVDIPCVGKPDSGIKDIKPVKTVDTVEYKNAMLKAFRTQFRNTVEIDGMNETTDSEGGYLVPTEYDKRLIQVMEEDNIMRKLGTIIRTSGERKINIAANKPAAAWIEEGQALTWGEATFDQKTLDAHKLKVAIKVTEELLYDSVFNLENYILTAFGKALSNAEETAFMTGNGTGEPTGIFDTTNGGTQYDSVTDKNFKADNILDLIYALKRPYRGKAKFIVNDATVATVRKFKDATGNYLWQPTFVAGEPDRLAGYELYTSAYAPTTGIAFGDFSYYNIGDRGQRSFQILKELFAGNGQVGYVATERVDGILVLKEAVQILTITT